MTRPTRIFRGRRCWISRARLPGFIRSMCASAAAACLTGESTDYLLSEEEGKILALLEISRTPNANINTALEIQSAVFARELGARCA